ncbi:CBN-GOS-28 protein [Carpediemonas membranifera]|uniref:CBN-GOS-28 protein n=1 Tax=Carpediemonas membranifera TaxID=201153 RepID=A0A8J6AVJ9_9EUKA|nr:CBN-GOS-28 protein [Carpediemonas membranifera]|eukprot:KAG9395278.1 CBN-GOS-28 protein [Carpediemonas membranifera]
MESFGVVSLEKKSDRVQSLSQKILEAFGELERLDETVDALPRRNELMSAVRESFEEAEHLLRQVNDMLHVITAADKAEWSSRIHAQREYLAFLQSDREVHLRIQDSVQMEADREQLLAGSAPICLTAAQTEQRGRDNLADWQQQVSQMLEMGGAAISDLGRQGAQLRALAHRTRVLVARFEYGRKLLGAIESTEKTNQLIAVGGMSLLIVGFVIVMWLLH